MYGYFVKMRHKCNSCKGTDGIYVKICRETGKVIENYKQQYERIVKELSENRNFIEHKPGIDEH